MYVRIVQIFVDSGEGISIDHAFHDELFNMLQHQRALCNFWALIALWGACMISVCTETLHRRTGGVCNYKLTTPIVLTGVKHTGVRLHIHDAKPDRGQFTDTVSIFQRSGWHQVG